MNPAFAGLKRWCSLTPKQQGRLSAVQKAESKRLQGEHDRSRRGANEAAGLTRHGNAEPSVTVASMRRLAIEAQQPVGDPAAALTALRELLSFGGSNGWGPMTRRLLAGGCTEAYEAACKELVRARQGSILRALRLAQLEVARLLRRGVAEEPLSHEELLAHPAVAALHGTLAKIDGLEANGSLYGMFAGRFDRDQGGLVSAQRGAAVALQWQLRAAALEALVCEAQQPVDGAEAALTALSELLSFDGSNGWGNMQLWLLAAGCTEAYAAASEELVRARQFSILRTLRLAQLEAAPLLLPGVAGARPLSHEELLAHPAVAALYAALAKLDELESHGSLYGMFAGRYDRDAEASAASDAPPDAPLDAPLDAPPAAPPAADARVPRPREGEMPEFASITDAAAAAEPPSEPPPGKLCAQPTCEAASPAGDGAARRPRPRHAAHEMAQHSVEGDSAVGALVSPPGPPPQPDDDAAQLELEMLELEMLDAPPDAPQAAPQAAAVRVPRPRAGEMPEPDSTSDAAAAAEPPPEAPSALDQDDAQLQLELELLDESGTGTWNGPVCRERLRLADLAAQLEALHDDPGRWARLLKRLSSGDAMRRGLDQAKEELARRIASQTAKRTTTLAPAEHAHIRTTMLAALSVPMAARESEATFGGAELLEWLESGSASSAAGNELLLNLEPLLPALEKKGSLRKRVEADPDIHGSGLDTSLDGFVAKLAAALAGHLELVINGKAVDPTYVEFYLSKDGGSTGALAAVHLLVGHTFVHGSSCE